MGTIKTYVVVDDNSCRKIILKGEEPKFKFDTEKYVMAEPIQGEGLYHISYSFKPGMMNQGYEVFSQMTEEQDKSDAGACTLFGRYGGPARSSPCHAPQAAHPLRLTLRPRLRSAGGTTCAWAEATRSRRQRPARTCSSGLSTGRTCAISRSSPCGKSHRRMPQYHGVCLCRPRRVHDSVL